MKLYKLTNANATTRPGEYNETVWEPGYEYTAVGKPRQALCSNGYIHAYEDLTLGLFLNPNHADFDSKTLRAFELSGRVVKRDGQLKVGCRKVTCVREVEVIRPTVEQCVRFAIGCGAAVSRNVDWLRWAEGWLNGSDRTSAAARAAAATEAAYATARAAEATDAYAYAAARAATEADLKTIAAWAMTDSIRLPK